MEQLSEIIKNIVNKLYGLEIAPDLTVPEAQFGDLSTNVAMRLSKQLGKNPREIAEQIKKQLVGDKFVNRVEVAGPGFINIFVNDDAMVESISQKVPQLLVNKKYVVEYSCPNAFKELHAGHLYQTIVGDVISRMLSLAGANVNRTNFGGDVGLHVAKAMFGIINEFGGEYPDKLSGVKEVNRANFLSKAYVIGAKAYEENDDSKKQIEQYNQQIYSVQKNDDTKSPFAQIYWTCRQWSYDYFDNFYARIEVDSFKYYPESVCTVPGLKLVNSGLEAGIFEKSDGAVVYRGEDKGLHTRVFITSTGLPTYETKDLGVISLEYSDYNFDHRILITGRDQAEYMKVVYLAAGELIPEVAGNMTHLSNGIIKFGDGKKMSSRLGNVTTATDVLNTVEYIVSEEKDPTTAKMVMLGAVKYAFLKQRLGGDIAFNPEESVSLQGNSGPYLQYAHARARSILEKSKVKNATEFNNLTEHERLLARELTHYQIALNKAINDLMPHHICTYLYDLAQVFNRFYENSKVVGDEREAIRRALVERYADTLKAGLEILGITAPNKM